MKSIVASAVLRRGMGLFLGTCLVLVMMGSAFAGNAYTDLKGRFAFDLPDGWKFDSSPAEGAFAFKGTSAETMMVMYDEEAKDPDKLLQSAAEMFKGSGGQNTALEGPVREMTVNKSPAKWAMYSAIMDAGQIKVKLFGAAGGITMKEGGGLWMLTILNETSRKKWEKELQKTFQSVRMP